MQSISPLVLGSYLLIALASATDLNLFVGSGCTGSALTTVRMHHNTCSCNSNTSGTCGDSWQKITRGQVGDGGYTYTHQVYADSSCLVPASSVPIVGSDGICVEGELLVSTKFTTSPVPSYMVMDCNPTSCTLIAASSNSAGTNAMSTGVGFLALVVTVAFAMLDY